MLKYILLLIIPGVLFSANINFERPSQVSKKASPSHVKKGNPQKTKEQKAEIDKVKKEKNTYKKTHIKTPTKDLIADFKKSTKRDPRLVEARKKAEAERRMKEARVRKK